ncbi:putative dehydrogenase [Lachnospiraceae bacterium PM6-15]|uniref:Gfo/Idh/MocA family protein n=1 Tax=Ohessyouella blattaphilus TaxID=2949333 RepID=UPI003E2D92FD
MSKKVKVALAGLGSRGKDSYAPVAEQYPDKMEIVAIADVDPEKVEEVAKRYHVPKEACFTSAEEMLKEERLADAMFITTQDRQHVPQAIQALKKGYDLLLEKPISPSLQECKELVKAAKKYNRRVIICHVLRYTPFFKKLKDLLDAGTIGEVVSVMAIENVGWYHQAHSFVRGNWNNSETTSPMILQKCCHDMDMYLWLTGKTCESVSSYGDTYLFKPEKAPEGASLRCMDGCQAKENCPFDAEKIYMDDKKIGIRSGHTTWPLDILSLHPTEESILEAIKEGPYGKCVYHCDNNVVDHQVLNLKMTDGSTISFTMCGLTATNSRYCKLMGTTGEIIADMESKLITVMPFGKEPEIVDVAKLATDFSGHGGGDIRLVEDFLDILSGEKEASSQTTALEDSVESHYLAFAAEESRKHSGNVVYLDSYREE